MYSTALPGGMIQFLDKLKDHEKLGVPKNAGTDSVQGFNLSRMRKLVSQLGNPLAKYPVVHVAGTKGKGSTVAFLSSILQAAGYSVGTYTSPHLRSIRERIAIGSPISEEALDDLYQSVQGTLADAIASESSRLTHFEVLTAIAFQYFAQQKVDIAIVETGLGGARDATNVVEPQGLAAAVISSIGEEHLEALGGSLESVALAKAGIIKHGRPVVLSRQTHSVADDILNKHAAGMNAPLIRAWGSGVTGAIRDYKKIDNEFVQTCDFEISAGLQLHGKSLNETIRLPGCELRMFGPHQLDNALTSICTALCLREQGWNISDAALRTGLETTSVPGRFQILSQEQATVLNASDATIVLDGAHTAGSAAALAATLRSLFPSEPLVLINAMASDKDHLGFASSLIEAKPVAVFLWKVGVAGSNVRSAPVEALMNAWTSAAASSESCEVQLLVSDSIRCAVTAAARLLQGQKQQGVICITGSLHAVASALNSCET